MTHFVLLQIWIANDLETIVNQLDDVYRFSYSPMHDQFGNLRPIANVEGGMSLKLILYKNNLFESITIRSRF